MFIYLEIPLKKTFLFTFTILSLLFLNGCSNLLLSESAIIKFDSSNNSRNTTETTTEQLTDIVLTGTFNKKTITLGKWNNYSELSGVAIEIKPGKWDFKLEANIGSKLYEGTINNIKIKPGENKLNFILDWLNPVFQISSDNLGSFYKVQASKEKNKNKILTFEITDQISTKEQWENVKSALSKPINNIYVNLKATFTGTFDCNPATDKTDPTPKALAIREVTIAPDSTRIGNFAFQKCSNITKLTLPANVSYGKSTFDGCKNISCIDYKGTLKEWCTFDHYTPRVHPQSENLNTLIIDGKPLESELVIPDNITSISDSAFKYCTNLTKIIIPDHVSNLSQQVFAYCYNLSDLEFAKNSPIKTLPEKMVYSCKNLNKITLPDNLETIGYFTFGRTGLKNIELPTKLSKIEGNAFDSCDKLDSIILPKSLTHMNAEIFQHCKKLTTLSIPENVNYIGKYFIFDSGIKTLKFEKTTGWQYTEEIKPRPAPKTIPTETISAPETMANECRLENGKYLNTTLENK